MPVTMLTTRDVAQQLREAYQSDNPVQIEQAWTDMQQTIANEVAQRMQADLAVLGTANEKAILAQRGYRTLTPRESAWYEKVISAMRSTDPKQAFATIIGSDNEEDLMPPTILEDVYRRLQEEHPLLKRLSVQQTGYLTKWILNAHTGQKAAWGAITAAVTQEITSSFQVIDVKQNKLSCFAILELGMLDLGPVFLDNYVRTCLYEAMACALEHGAICGTGKDMPAGMDRDLGPSSYNTESGWKQKTPVSVTGFDPGNYGALLAKLATDANGKTRNFSQVTLICSLPDYLTKVMPATTMLTSSGAYASNLFPFPTEVVVSNFVTTGQAILGLPEEYMLCMGASSRSGVITYDDSVKFLDDQRVFKVVQYADGRAADNTSFLLLDISTLEPAYVTVKQVTAAEQEAAVGA